MELSVSPLKRRLSQDWHQEQSTKIRKVTFPTQAHESFLSQKKEEALLCISPQLHDFQMHSDALTIFDTADNMMCCKDIPSNMSVFTSETDNGNLHDQTASLAAMAPTQPPSGWPFETDSNDMQNISSDVNDGNRIQVSDNLESVNEFAVYQQQSQKHVFPLNSFPLSGINSHNCPECAAGKPGHIRHIGRWRLMDSS